MITEEKVAPETAPERQIIPLSAAMKAQAALKFLVAQAAQREFVAFVEGCKFGLGLDGAYSLDTTTWAFQAMEKPTLGK